MPSKYVSLEKVRTSRLALRDLLKVKRPAVRTEHFATFSANYSEIKALRKRNVSWEEIQQRYYGSGKDVPHVRTLQRYFTAVDEQRGRRAVVASRKKRK